MFQLKVHVPIDTKVPHKTVPSEALLPLSLPLASLCLSLAYCSEVMQVHCSWPLLLLLLLDEATIDLDLEGEAGVERELCLVLLRMRE